MKKILLFSCLVVLALSSRFNFQKQQANDIVDPVSIGWPEDINFKIYSGYLDLWKNGSQLAHYIFLTSQTDPVNDPVVLWLNGGPGCSSLLGYIQENGPFLFLGTNTSFQNNLQYSWNRVANVLYLESPPGVGYSINNITGYVYSDENTGVSNFWALQRFYELFPQYQQNEFWLSGESYAGMYIPFTTEQIRLNNLNVQPGTIEINVKGFLIGNNVFIMDEDMLNSYTSNTYVTHQFLNKDDTEAYYAYCIGKPNSPNCRYVSGVLSNTESNTDPYQIYAYTYGYRNPNNNNKRITSSAQARALLDLIKRRRNILDKHYADSPEYQATGVPQTPDDVIDQYFNNKTIQQALNVYDTLQKYSKGIFKFKWTTCSNLVGILFQRAANSSYLFPNLLQAGYQILIYSGNTDGVVPFQYSKYCIDDIFNNYNVDVTEVQPWSLWGQLPSKQLGGWVQTWRNNKLAAGAPKNNFTYAVVRAAGHEVPEYQPEAAYYMFYNFTRGLPI